MSAQKEIAQPAEIPSYVQSISPNIELPSPQQSSTEIRSDHGDISADDTISSGPIVQL